MDSTWDLSRILKIWPIISNSINFSVFFIFLSFACFTVISFTVYLKCFLSPSYNDRWTWVCVCFSSYFFLRKKYLFQWLCCLMLWKRSMSGFRVVWCIMVVNYIINLSKKQIGRKKKISKWSSEPNHVN